MDRKDYTGKYLVFYQNNSTSCIAFRTSLPSWMASSYGCGPKISYIHCCKSSWLAMPDLKEAKTGKGGVVWSPGNHFVRESSLFGAYHFQVNYAQRDESLWRFNRRAGSSGKRAVYPFFLCLTAAWKLAFDVDHAYAEFFRSLGGEKSDVS